MKKNNFLTHNRDIAIFNTVLSSCFNEIESLKHLYDINYEKIKESRLIEECFLGMDVMKKIDVVKKDNQTLNYKIVKYKILFSNIKEYMVNTMGNFKRLYKYLYPKTLLNCKILNTNSSNDNMTSKADIKTLNNNENVLSDFKYNRENIRNKTQNSNNFNKADNSNIRKTVINKKYNQRLSILATHEADNTITNRTLKPNNSRVNNFIVKSKAPIIPVSEYFDSLDDINNILDETIKVIYEVYFPKVEVLNNNNVDRYVKPKVSTLEVKEIETDIELRNDNLIKEKCKEYTLICYNIIILI